MALQYHMALSGVISIYSTSCTSYLHPKDFGKLPQPSGVYGGSLLHDPWVYRGTDNRGNHFTYTWNTNNALHNRALITPAETVPGDEQFDLTLDRKSWRGAVPILSDSGDLASFKILPPIRERINADFVHSPDQLRLSL